MKLCGSFVLITLACAERLSKYRTDDIAQAAQARYAQAESMEGNSSVKWFTPSRMEYVKSKMAIEYEVIKPFTSKADSLQVELASGTPKVAFLFLTMKDFPWQELWDKFFHDAPKDQYSIYIHRALLKDQEQRMAHWLPLGQYGPIEVPWVRTAWCALFGVEVASLFEAMKDPLNVQFVFVSDSSVPLKPFSYVYNELARNSPQTSKICLASRASSGQAKVEFTKQEAKRSCFFRDFLRDINPRTMKHHQWAVFNRPHAWKIVKYAEEALTVYEVAWLNAAPDMDVTAEGCSDEAVPLTALLYSLDVEKKSTGNTWTDLTRLGVEENCLTFIRWRNCFVGTDLDLSTPKDDLLTLWNNMNEVMHLGSIDLSKSALKRELNGFPHAFSNITESYLETLVSQNFMFARKFHPGAYVSEENGGWFHNSNQPKEALTEALPKLWSKLDQSKAQKSQWSLLEFDGRPGDPLRKP